MVDQLSQYRFSIPFEHMGDILGELSALGAWLDSHEIRSDEKRVTFLARVPVEKIDDVRVWLMRYPDAEMMPVE